MADERSGAERQRIHETDETIDEIRALAAELITTRPGGTVPLIHWAEFPGRPVRYGWAEVARVWPVGDFSLDDRDYWPEELCIDGQGRLVQRLREAQPLVAPTKDMIWTPEREVRPPLGPWRATLVERLRRDAAAAPSPGDLGPPPSLPTNGRAMTREEREEARRLEGLLYQARQKWGTLRHRHGEPPPPGQLDSPGWRQRRAWQRIDALERQIIDLDRAIGAIKGYGTPIEPPAP